jgi:sec-independent protein translocase protein TatA
MELFQPWHLLIVALIAVIFFGGKRLPELGKGLGEGWKGFKDGLSGATDSSTAAKPGDTAHTVTPAPKPGDDLKPPAA